MSQRGDKHLTLSGEGAGKVNRKDTLALKKSEGKMIKKGEGGRKPRRKGEGDKRKEENGRQGQTTGGKKLG